MYKITDAHKCQYFVSWYKFIYDNCVWTQLLKISNFIYFQYHLHQLFLWFLYVIVYITFLWLLIIWIFVFVQVMKYYNTDTMWIVHLILFVYFYCILLIGS